MRQEFLIHNFFRKDTESFFHNDPHLSVLKELAYVSNPSLINEIPLYIPGIYILTGGRQVGKSTLIKLIIKKLLIDEKIPPHQIFYLPCDLLLRHYELTTVLMQIFEDIQRDEPFYIFLDEITYVREWDRTIKYFADMGYFRKGSLLITGSDSVILRETMKKFPGRRGASGSTDYHYYPLSFSEFIEVTEPRLWDHLSIFKKIELEKFDDESLAVIDQTLTTEVNGNLEKAFSTYLSTGGFLPALNDYGKSGKIQRYVYQIYQEWVIGDMLKRNKKEHYLKDIVRTVGERVSTQLTLNSIASVTEIQHHATVQDYLTSLEDMDVLFLLYALREDSLQPAYKKAKKVHFSDPFIYHSLIAWAHEQNDPWEYAERSMKERSSLPGALVEGCVASILRRHRKIHYIKSKGEIDIALLRGDDYLPIEIKWSQKLRSPELKEILRHKQGIIGYRGSQPGRFEHLLISIGR